jgi:hypothetical protein
MYGSTARGGATPDHDKRKQCEQLQLEARRNATGVMVRHMKQKQQPDTVTTETTVNRGRSRCAAGSSPAPLFLFLSAICGFYTRNLRHDMQVVSYKERAGDVHAGLTRARGLCVASSRQTKGRLIAMAA